MLKCIICGRKAVEESEDDIRCQGCGHNEIKCDCKIIKEE